MSRRRRLLLLTAVTALVTLTAVSSLKKQDHPQLGWARQGKDAAPPVAVLIEMGVKDTSATPWPGRLTVTGARVVQRQGYRFREEDRLVGDGWQASSHLGLRIPRSNALVASLEGIAPVGVIVHLADVRPDAVLEVEAGKPARKARVPLAEVLAGTRVPLWDGKAVARLISTTTPLSSGPSEDDFPAAAHAPDGTLWVAYIRYHIQDQGRRIEQQSYLRPPADFKDLYTPEFRDELVVRSCREGRWDEPVALTPASEDLVRCAVAAAGNGDVWVFYSAQRQGKYQLLARCLSPRFSPEATARPAPRPGPEIRLTRGDGPHLTPVACTDSAGVVHVACQAWLPEKNAFGIVAFAQKDDGFEQEHALTGAGENHWSPFLAGGPDGALACAGDVYAQGDYDTRVYLGHKDRLRTVAGSQRFEARPAMVFDPRGRLWIAYEEGPERWGKDYGALDTGEGNPLYNERAVQVVCLENGRLMRPAAELPRVKVPLPQIPYDRTAGFKFESGRRYNSPRLGLDGKGRLWLTYRVKYGSRYSSHPGSYWISYATMLQGDRWSEPIEILHSDGLLDNRPALLPHPAGGLQILHNGDGRVTLPETVHNRVYVSHVRLPGDPVEPALVPHEPGAKGKDTAYPEDEAVRRIREYRIQAGGKSYRLLRGEFHRHTDVSWDGGPDGSLEDMFRYGLDGAAMDWIGNGDHDNGAGREYPWWLTQKLTDAYHVPGRFTPMFTYERSVSYPHGHRNCMFSKRGVRTLPRLGEMDPKERVGGVHADDTKMLYRYLRELDGICAVHTSATGMGTDWRDNDPAVEPIVEIYQGDRMSYEKEGAPRAGYDPKEEKEPANIGGWYPKGFVDNALAKGYRLSFQSSSDHWSTHISYCIVMTESFDREGILAAVKKRHCYGATDNIILDVSSGQAVMGDEVKTSQAPALRIFTRGTAPLERIDILKDTRVVETLKPEGMEARTQWTDPSPTTGTHYYYVRVLQKDGEIAWGSPLWIDYRP